MRTHCIKRLISILIGLTCIIGNGIFAAEEKPKGPPKRLVPVVAITANEVFMAPTTKVPGTITSRQQAQLPAEVDARLTWVADVGTQIKKGEPIARLDDTLYRLRAAENKATLQQELSQLKFLEKELARLEELKKSNFSSLTELDRTRLDRDLASSELVVAKAKIKVDEETLARYVVKAPFDGVVIERARREGEWINVGETVLTLSNPSQLEIEARVNEESVRFLKPGDSVNIFRKNQMMRGKLRTIVSIGDAQSHLFAIRVDLKKSAWLAGQTVKVEVPVGESSTVLAVPRDALVLRSNGASIFKLSVDNIAQKVEITTGIASNDLIEIKGNVVAGDAVVIRGSERLRSGQEVKIIPSDNQ